MAKETSSFDLTPIEQMHSYAVFGKAVIELAMQQEIIPRKQRVKRVVVEKKVVQYRRKRGPNKPKVAEPTTEPTAEESAQA